ncbi:MAG: PIN domain-containing protein [Pseudomonadota bacterium]
MRVFPDTNVLYAALATRGLCSDLLRALLAEHDVVIGAPVLVELRRNLLGKLRMPANRVETVTGFVSELELAPSAPLRAGRPARIDAADAAILECAARARVDIVVTGDGALLNLGEYAGIPVVSPRDLWQRLRHGGR